MTSLLNEKAQPPAGAVAEAGRLQRMLGIVFFLKDAFQL